MAVLMIGVLVGIPVVDVHWGNYEDTLDALHDHVLCCIESIQMQRM